MGNRLYTYKAAAHGGEIIRGSALATDAQALYQQLRDQNHFLISTRVKRGLLTGLFKTKVTPQELLDFCLHMQYMDQAGVPLLDALLDAQSSSTKLKPVLADMITQIKGGRMLSETIASHKDTFPDMFQPIIYLSEQSGQLAQGFKTLYEHLSWKEQNKRQLSKSLQYPAMVFGLICVVMWMMSVVVVPQMFDLIKMSGVEVPYSTRLLLDINQGLVQWAPRALMLGACGLLLIMGLRFLSLSHKLRQDRLLLKVPFIGQLLVKRDLAMYLHFFHVCLTSHIDLLECMDYGRKAVRNCWLQERLAACAKAVREGSTLSKAMQNAGIFDASTLRMVQIGEITGHLTALLAVLENYHVRDLKRQIERFLTYLQPGLLGIIGLMLICVVGIFYPLYDQLLVIEG